jgi:hypothetical protein
VFKFIFSPLCDFIFEVLLICLNYFLDLFCFAFILQDGRYNSAFSWLNVNRMCTLDGNYIILCAM